MANLSAAIVPAIIALSAIVGLVVLGRRRAKGRLIWGEGWMCREWFAPEEELSPAGCVFAALLVWLLTLAAGALMERGWSNVAGIEWTIGVLLVTIAVLRLRPRNRTHLAAHRGNLQVLARCLEKKPADLSACDIFWRTPLHYAAAAGQMNTLRALLERGADVAARSRGGFSALHFAAMGGHVGAVELLIGHRPDANAIADDGTTPLHWAAGKGYVRCVVHLLSAGPDLNIADRRGRTPLQMALKRRHGRIADLLRRHGAIEAAP